jgi:poly-gamma-glutamate synthesis protein (capsule biosynthesis protein)
MATRRVFLCCGAAAAAGGNGGVQLFLCGDVMTGRGIDQILPRPSKPHIEEPLMKSALGYVELAERVNGRIPRRAGFSYVWGGALEEFARMKPDWRIVNLETSVTVSEDRAPKGINYRMHPANAPCLKAAGIDCAALANNHVLDWGAAGLMETLGTLAGLGIKTAGAGRNLEEAAAPAILARSAGARVLVFSCGLGSSGIPAEWAAGEKKAGVWRLPDPGPAAVRAVAERVKAAKRAEDLAVLSIHWGGNWGYEIPPAHRAFAHAVIESAGVDLVHGHSSHHPLGIEVWRGRLILYGCGDFLNDYEGIGGYEEYRSHLALMYFATLRRDGKLERLEVTPLAIRRFRLERAGEGDAGWLQARLDREGRKFGTRVSLNAAGRLTVGWTD